MTATAQSQIGQAASSAHIEYLNQQEGATTMNIIKNLDSQKIIKSIEPYQVVTFDVFDTLVKRDIKSFKDMVSLMDEEYFHKTNQHLPIYFYRERLHAPKIVRKNHPNKDVNLNDIYNVLHIKNKDMVKNIECRMELKCAVANKTIYEVYKYCLESGKKIYAISDMYLPEECIRKMLEKCGYNIEKIYVSQEHNASKGSGKLFQIFLTKNNITPDKVIHIGDNYKADILGAQKNRISSILIPNINDRLRYSKQNVKRSAEKNILYQSINNRLAFIENIAEKTGYEVLGPILYYFVRWLEIELKNNDINKVYFLSRDGYLIKKAYELLSDQNNLDIYYLSLSSKSVKNAYRNQKQQRNLLVQYLKQNMMYGKVAIIDIGWSGRLHKMLREISAEFADIYGFYFGTFKAFYKNVKNAGNGYIAVNRNTRAKIYMNAGFIELLFSDTLHGTTESYTASNGNVFPILSQPNPNGEIIRKIQVGALKFVSEWKNSEFSNFNYTSDFLLKPLLNLCMHPKPEDLDLLSKEFVGSGTEYEYISGREVSNLNLFAFARELQNACWKGGFLSKSFQLPILNKLYEIINPLFLYYKV